MASGPPLIPRFTRVGSFPHAPALSKILPSVVRGLDCATMIGELSTRATVSTGTTSNHGFRRKCLTGSDVNDGFGSKSALTPTAAHSRFTFNCGRTVALPNPSIRATALNSCAIVR